MTSKRNFEVWLIATLKGGVRKSTTAMFLAFVAAQRDRNVLVIDADHGTQGVTDWATHVYANDDELPFDVAQWAPSVGILAPFVMKKARETEADLVIIDVGGEAPEVLRQAAILANVVVSPTGAEHAEVGRIGATQAILAEEGIQANVLLTRVSEPGKGAAHRARASLVETGYHVLDTEIRQNRETYSHVWGSIPSSLGAYVAVADELQKLGGN